MIEESNTDSAYYSKILTLSWYCNAGILVRNSTFLSHRICLCPYGYYGERCEFQRRRVRINLNLIANDHYSNYNIIIKLVIYLTTPDIDHVLDYEEEVFVPYENRHKMLSAVGNHRPITLLFPINKSIGFEYHVKIDAFIVTETSVEFQASWHYALLFQFMPVQFLAFELFLSSPTPIIGPCAHGQRRPFINNLWKTWCQCELGWKGSNCNEPDLMCQRDTCSEGSICIPTKNHPICLCTSYRMGPTCRVTMDLPCLSVPCKNNGICIRMTYRSSASYCLCKEGFTGLLCEKIARQLNIQFSDQFVKKYSFIQALILHLHSVLPVLFTTEMTPLRIHLVRNVQSSNKLKTIFVSNFRLINFGFIQVFVSPSDNFGQYYLILSRNVHEQESTDSDDPMTINTTVIERNRCRYVKEIFNGTILAFTSMHRAKFYHEPCQNNLELVCFYDENWMCICNRYRLTQCFSFFHQTTNCSEKHECLNGGLCIQESEIRNPLDYFCICEECYFGDMCQFTTSQYLISLDALIGQNIKTEERFHGQSTLVKISFVVMVIFVVVGFFLNTLTIVLFIRKEKCRETGCGLYILNSSIFGLCSLFILFLKFISLVFNIIMSNHLGCILLEYFLKSLPAVVDWVNMFVTAERLWIARHQTNLNKAKSRRIAKIVILLTSFLVMASLIHDPFHRTSLVDPRLDFGRRAWCVVQYERKSIRLYNMVVNLLHCLIPFTVGLICTIFILINFAQTKAKAKRQTFNSVFTEQLLNFRHWIISPIVLFILALPRIIFSLTFTCISKESHWEIYILIISYFIAFLPQMGAFIIFVLPSQAFMNELRPMLKGAARP